MPDDAPNSLSEKREKGRFKQDLSVKLQVDSMLIKSKGSDLQSPAL